MVHQDGVEVDWSGDVEEDGAPGASEVPAVAGVRAVDDVGDQSLSSPHRHSEHGDL